MLNSEYFEDVLAHVYKIQRITLALVRFTTTKQKLSPILDLQGIARFYKTKATAR
jgi:hypothetical protein